MNYMKPTLNELGPAEELVLAIVNSETDSAPELEGLSTSGRI